MLYGLLGQLYNRANPPQRPATFALLLVMTYWTRMKSIFSLLINTHTTLTQMFVTLILVAQHTRLPRFLPGHDPGGLYRPPSSRALAESPAIRSPLNDDLVPPIGI